MQNIPLAAGFALLAFVSAASGYLAGRHGDDASPETPGKGGLANTRSISRLTKIKETPASAADGKNIRLDIRSKDLGKILALYSRMTAEELEREIALWPKNRPYNQSEKEKTALDYLAYRWGQLSQGQAVEKLKTMGKFSSRIGSEVFQGWANARPKEAADYLARHKEDIPDARWLLRDVARDLAAVSPDQALQWAAGLDKELRGDVLPGLMSEVAAGHPDQLPAAIGKLTEEDLRTTFLTEDLAARWATIDSEAARRWMDSLEGTENHRYLYCSVLGKLGALDLEKATAEYQKLDKENRWVAALSITRSLNEKSPLSAINWLMTNHTGEEAAQYIGGIASSSSGLFSQAVLREYAVEMPDGPARDSLLAGLIGRGSNLFNGQSPSTEKTLSLINEIKNPAKKKEALESALHSWSYQYPEQATSWLKTAPLPDELKQELEKNIQNRR